MNKETSKFDKMSKDFSSDFEDGMEAIVEKMMGEGKYNGWTQEFTITKFDLEDMKKELREEAKQCLFNQQDSLDDVLKEKKEEIKEMLKEIDKLTDAIKEEKDEEERKDAADAIVEITDEIEKTLKELTY